MSKKNRCSNMFITKKKIIVASGSPRRQQFFKDLGIDFQVLDVQKQELVCAKGRAVPKQGLIGFFDTEARPLPGEKPQHYALRMARQKLCDALNCLGLWQDGAEYGTVFQPAESGRETVLELSYPLERHMLKPFDAKAHNGLVLTADTIVCFGTEILGKPKSCGEAFAMLQKLKGKTHTVMTAVAFADLAEQACYAFCDKTDVTFMPWGADLLRAYAQSGESLDKAGAYGISGPGSFLASSVHGCIDTVIGLPVAKCVEFLLWNTAAAVKGA